MAKSIKPKKFEGLQRYESLVHCPVCGKEVCVTLERHEGFDEFLEEQGVKRPKCVGGMATYRDVTECECGNDVQVMMSVICRKRGISPMDVLAGLLNG